MWQMHPALVMVMDPLLWSDQEVPDLFSIPSTAVRTTALQEPLQTSRHKITPCRSAMPVIVNPPILWLRFQNLLELRLVKRLPLTFPVMVKTTEQLQLLLPAL